MANGIDYSADGVTFRVEGLRRTVRALSAAGADAEDLKALMKQIGETVVTAARPETPVGGPLDKHPGRLAGSLRAGAAKTKAVVRAGSARVPYAGVQEYGWPAHNIEAHHYLRDALQRERQQIFEQLDQGIAELLRQHHLS